MTKKFQYLVQIQNDFDVDDTIVDTDVELDSLEDDTLIETLSHAFELNEEDEISIINLNATNRITLGA